MCSSDLRVAYSLYDTLVWRNYLSLPDGSGAELVPGLATSWTQVTPTEWDFTIRQGVKFHDGTTMTTEDVAFSINNTYGDGKEPFAASGTIASVVALDANTVRITTKNPDPALLARMATVMGQVYPKAYYEKVGQEEFGRIPIGTGPYKWAGRVTGESIKLAANDDYWGAKPPLHSITFLEVPEVSSRIAGLITGEYDIVTSLPPDQTRPIDDDDATEIRAVAVENVQMVTFRQYKKDRPISDKRIRKAMVLSLDRALLAEKLWAGMTESGTYDFAGYGAYSLPDRGALPLDPCRIQPAGDRVEEGARIVRQELVDLGRVGDEFLVAAVLAVENAQRVLLQPLLRILRQFVLHAKEILDQRGAPGFAAVAIAQRVEMQRHAGDAEFLQQLVGHGQQFDIGLWFTGTDDFRIDLVELAIAPLLRALVTEQRPMRRQLYRGMLLPAIGKKGAGNPGGEFGTQGQALAAAIGEAVHFLRDHIGRLADRAAEYLGLPEHRPFRPAAAA